MPLNSLSKCLFITQIYSFGLYKFVSSNVDTPLITIGYAVQKSSESKRFKEITEKLKVESEDDKRNIEKSLQITTQYMQKIDKEMNEQKALDKRLSEDK
jgi:hypothetical protein